jgi:2'-5' RNA ligase
MADRLRLFVALDPPREIGEVLGRALESVRRVAPAEKWSRTESLHLTLSFLGHLPSELLDEVRSALAAVSAGRAPFPIRMRGAGVFGRGARARVLWLGVEGGEALASLHAAIVRELGAIGHREDRPYHPHLTLARSRDPRGSRALIDAQGLLASLDLGSFVAREFVLYRSELGPGGSRYTPLATFPLSSADDGSRAGPRDSGGF